MRYDFHNLKSGRVMTITSAVNGAAYASIHPIGQMSEREAKVYFNRAHKAEVMALMQQQLVKEKIISNEIDCD